MADVEKDPIKVELVKKPFYKKWWFWLIIVIVAIGATSSNSETAKTGSDPSEIDKSSQGSPTTAELKPVAVGQVIQVGEVKWKVDKVETSAEIKSDNQYIESAKAGGKFIIVSLTAELVGKESGNIDSSQLAVIDSTERKFEPSQDSNVYGVLGDDLLFLKQVNPNIPINGRAVFDVAKDATGLKLQIGDLRILEDNKGYVDLGI